MIAKITMIVPMMIVSLITVTTIPGTPQCLVMMGCTVTEPITVVTMMHIVLYTQETLAQQEQYVTRLLIHVI